MGLIFWFVQTYLLYSIMKTQPNIVKPPYMIDTPYGGQLIWQLPKDENKLTVHLKDKTKIRHKKRWSQVGVKYDS